MQVKAYHDFEVEIKTVSAQSMGEIERMIQNTKDGTISLSVKDGEVVRVDKYEQYRW